LRLIFKQRHLSIEQFDPIETPDFVVLTGVNGSGKSHLLEAIEKRYIDVEGMQSPHIVLFNYETFKLDNEAAFNAQQLSSEKEAAWQFHQGNVLPHAQNWRGNLANTYDDLKKECKNESKPFWNLPDDKVINYKINFKNLFNQQHIKQNPQAMGLYALAKEIPYLIDDISHDDFTRLYKPFVFKNDFLPQQLGKIFWDYFVKFYRNQVYRFENESYAKTYPALSEGEFIKEHGEKPWDLVNKILDSFDTLTYRVTSPEGSDVFGNFQLKLKHTSKPNLEIEFSHLSSGERVLMALVASIYKSSADKHFPDLLLLDEVDASLHPSMMKNMLDVIENVFVRQGVKVILITHSPTTLALASDESVFVMNRSGLNRIEKKSKQDALGILTQGFATLEQGLKLIDQISKTKTTIITEGNNASIIEKLIRMNGVTDIEVFRGIENASGKSQLKTIFEFLAIAPHTTKVIFVWDCDVNYEFEAKNHTYPFILRRNENNRIAKKGIENAFPESLFEGFKKKITDSFDNNVEEFDEKRKRDFEKHILNNASDSDFSHFSELLTEINRIKKI
jgi:energy-coupling factor transporter ATP-binding protein EcfA2